MEGEINSKLLSKPNGHRGHYRQQGALLQDSHGCVVILRTTPMIATLSLCSFWSFCMPGGHALSLMGVRWHKQDHVIKDSKTLSEEFRMFSFVNSLMCENMKTFPWLQNMCLCNYIYLNTLCFFIFVFFIFFKSLLIEHTHTSLP